MACKACEQRRPEPQEDASNGGQVEEGGVWRFLVPDKISLTIKGAR